MNRKQLILIIVGILVFQLIIGPWMTIRNIRPDFFLILVVYVGVTEGSFVAVIVGFICGLLLDSFGVGSYFGLSSHIYVLAGYASGFLKDTYQLLAPVLFTSLLIGIFCIAFFIYAFVRFQYICDENFLQFLNIWALTTLYTLSIMGIIPFIRPIR